MDGRGGGKVDEWMNEWMMHDSWSSHDTMEIPILLSEI